MKDIFEDICHPEKAVMLSGKGMSADRDTYYTVHVACYWLAANTYRSPVLW